MWFLFIISNVTIVSVEEVKNIPLEVAKLLAAGSFGLDRERECSSTFAYQFFKSVPHTLHGHF